MSRTLSTLALTALAAGSVLALGAARPDGAVKISGSAELTYAKQESVAIPSRENHLFMLGETRGINKNTSAIDYFSDAEVVNAEMGDLQGGNGPHHGYYTMTKNGESAVAQWQGKVTTTMVDGQPRTAFRGTWKYVHGTGQYATIQGSGTYEGRFLAQDRYAVTWEGSYRK